MLLIEGDDIQVAAALNMLKTIAPSKETLVECAKILENQSQYLEV